MISEYRKEFHPEVLCLIETRVSGCLADDIVTKLGYCNSFRVEANDFAGGIWLYWTDDVSVDIIQIHS